MRKLIIYLAIFICLANLWSNFALAATTDAPAETPKLIVYFFWGNGCPHCVNEKEFFKKIINDYPQVEIKDFEIWYDSDNAKLLQEISQKLHFDIQGIPLTIIGEQTIVGFLNERTTGKQIKALMDKCTETICADPVAEILNAAAQANSKNTETDNNPNLIDLPIIGEVDTQKYSLPVLTLIIAALDGFNPCAMWILIFLISLLLGMQDKKRMWILGSTFIITSGLVYFLFLTAWLKLFIFISFIRWVRLLIAVVALISGVHYLNEFRKNTQECKVIKGERREKIITNLKFITKLPTFWLALLGMIVIAFAVNLIELVCSIGLPAIYTNILSLANLPSWQYYLLLLFYVFIFMLDDMLVFIAAMLTLQSTNIGHKYARYANLIGGIVILIIGLLLIFKPEWLMFG